MAPEQKHPQYITDRKIVDTLLQREATALNLVELARLKIRYQGFPGAWDIQQDLEKVLQAWNLTEESLFNATRAIHAQGLVYKNRNSDQEDWM